MNSFPAVFVLFSARGSCSGKFAGLIGLFWGSQNVLCPRMCRYTHTLITKQHGGEWNGLHMAFHALKYMLKWLAAWLYMQNIRYRLSGALHNHTLDCKLYSIRVTTSHELSVSVRFFFFPPLISFPICVCHMLFTIFYTIAFAKLFHCLQVMCQSVSQNFRSLFVLLM